MQKWITILILVAGVTAAMADERQKLIDSVGIKPENGMRGQMDAVGFVTTATQMDTVLAQSRALASARAKKLAARGIAGDQAFAAAVCPHDDYYYASRLYALVTPHIRAKTVILFGVFHKARAFDWRDRLVFESFHEWRGPYGPVAVSPLREELMAKLPADDFVVNNDMQQVEHSVEGIVPWLQANRRDVEILSILVPYMGWERMAKVTRDVSAALATIMKERGMVLGRDVAIISSSDAVHYGDAGWGGSNHAEFGTTPEGYAKAVARDRMLMQTDLAGLVRENALRNFLYTCVDSKDVTRYKLTWCGRFSVPFGLAVASRVRAAQHGAPLKGTILDYGTSLSEVSLDLDKIPGLGTTAPNNLHHWVGYPAIGYW